MPRNIAQRLMQTLLQDFAAAAKNIVGYGFAVGVSSLFSWALIATAAQANTEINPDYREFFTTTATVQELIDELQNIPDISVETSEDTQQQFEIYYDTPEFHYSNKSGFIRFQATPYLSKKQNLKYTETIQHTDNAGVLLSYGVKHYNNVKDPQEKHSLLGMVRRNARGLFVERLKLDGVEYPMRLKPIFKIAKSSQSMLLRSNDNSAINLTITKLQAIDSDTSLSLVQLWQESAGEENNLAINSASASQAIRFIHSLETLTSLSKVAYENEYKLMLDTIIKADDTFLFKFKYPALSRLGNAIFISLFGLAILLILFIRRGTSSNYSINNGYS